MRKRVQNDEGLHPIRVLEGEGQRDGTSKGFADDDRSMIRRRDRVDDAREIGGENIEALRVISKRIRSHSVGSFEERNLTVEQLWGSVHARYKDHRPALASNREAGVVVPTHRGRR